MYHIIPKIAILSQLLPQIDDVQRKGDKLELEILSLDDYWDQTYPVEFKVNLQSAVTYYGLDETLSEQIRTVAERQGISPTKLLNLWVQEKLQQEIA